MRERAAHLVDRVIPDVSVRQWVLSLPWSLRSPLAFDAALCREVLAVYGPEHRLHPAPPSRTDHYLAKVRLQGRRSIRLPVPREPSKRARAR